MLLKSILREPRSQLPILLRKPQTQLPILLVEYRISEKDLHLSSVSWRTADQKSLKIGEPRAQFAIILGDSQNLGEGLA
jgi:hypothetical protein